VDFQQLKIDSSLIFDPWSPVVRLKTLDLLKKTCASAGMAGWTLRPYAYYQSVLVAIGHDSDHLLKIPRCFTFVPKLASASAEKHRLAQFPSFDQAFATNIGNRQYLTRSRILHYCGNYTSFVPFKITNSSHSLSLLKGSNYPLDNRP